MEQPFSEGALVAGQCHVNLQRATRAIQGTWNIFLGIPGRVQEVHTQRQVFVKCKYKISIYETALHKHCT